MIDWTSGPADAPSVGSGDLRDRSIHSRTFAFVLALV